MFVESLPLVLSVPESPGVLSGQSLRVQVCSPGESVCVCRVFPLQYVGSSTASNTPSDLFLYVGPDLDH